VWVVAVLLLVLALVLFIFLLRRPPGKNRHAYAQIPGGSCPCVIRPNTARPQE